MATDIYDIGTIKLINGEELEIIPLKIKYLKEFMSAFGLLSLATNDEQAIRILSECARICMKQYKPEISTIEDLEDEIDLPTLYQLLDFSAGIKIDNPEENVKGQAQESGDKWEDLDLAKLESEVFLLGIWKNYEDLETSISMPELIVTLGARRDLDYQEKKFLAAMQGVDLDKQSGRNDEWEEMKARVFSGGKTSNPNDIVSFQGSKASKAGFGIGMGLEYEKMN